MNPALKKINVFSLALLLSFLAPSLGLAQSHAEPCKGQSSSSFLDKVSYYLSKIPEAVYLLNWNDLKMMKAGSAAANNKKNSQMKVVSLGQVRLFHPISTPEAVEKTEKRANSLRKFKDQLLKDQAEGKIFTSQKIDEVVPSIDPIQLINFKGEFLVIQGQGRLASMKKVFPEDFKIEVEVSDLDEPFLGNLVEVRNQYISSGQLTGKE